jgi:hypothetical protein
MGLPARWNQSLEISGGVAPLIVTGTISKKVY